MGAVYQIEEHGEFLVCSWWAGDSSAQLKAMGFDDAQELVLLMELDTKRSTHLDYVKTCR